MTEIIVGNPLAEQEICVKCGLCCDGTLFTYAVLQAGEQGNLPEKIEEKYGKKGEKEFFTLPCSYFSGQCTIYNKRKASICSAFRCRLLKDFSKGKITQTDALKVVDNALKLKEEIYQLYYTIFETEYTNSFQELLSQLPDINRKTKEDKLKSKYVDLLILKCGLYDTLLTKSFKPAKKFEDLLKASME